MLANKALLVHVSISQWTGRKFDGRATRTVSKSHNTSSEAGNYTKKLLPGSQELAAVALKAKHIREYVYRETLPWFSDGARIIKAESFTRFIKTFGKMKDDYDKAVDDFLKVYPFLKEHAQNSLGSLYSPEDYPDVFRLSRKFNCDVNIMPLPDVKDFRTEISDAEKRKFIKKMEQVQQDAMQDCWNRLYEVLNTAVEKLAKPDAIFKNSLLENVSEICTLLPRLNITDDPKLEAKRKQVEGLIAKMSPDVLRDNPTERQDAASELAKVMKSMGPFMGKG